MKPLSQMTFEEASRARSALAAIAEILVSEGLVEHKRPFAAAEKEKELLGKVAALGGAIAARVPVSKPEPRKRKPGHKSRCANPACYRRKAGKTYIRRTKHQRFCRTSCGTDYFNRIRNYARSVVLGSPSLKNKWLKSDPWLNTDEVNKDVDRIIRLEEKILRRNTTKAKQQTKGVTLLKTTPTASGH